MPSAIKETSRPISEPGLRDNPPAEREQVADKTAAQARLNIRHVAQAGKLYSLAVDRCPGMPMFHGHCGVDSLGRSDPISVDELKSIAKGAGVELGQGDIALVRRGYLSHWPNIVGLEAHRGSGPDLSAARWFAECGVVAC